METKLIYNNLIQVLRLVASEANVQIESFPQYVNVTDEIALLYSDIYSLVPQLVDAGLILPQHLAILNRIDNLFEVMSNNETLWNLERLEDNASWKQSRLLAFEALMELNVSYEKPNLDFVKWMKS
ncbi:hypothetical protein [Bacteroides sp. 1001136B_160425_E2]|uniref:hypothetical protein n=1 Tax=Bacteroides sp. 1001136B_160425_E2 TaxID=2787083 RepID=UPI00189EA054|nr:hypothetical protein [Bacteroides sp. 1001136B_160425_E2]